MLYRCCRCPPLGASRWKEYLIACEARLAELLAVAARSSREERWRHEAQLPASGNGDEVHFMPNHDVYVPQQGPMDW